MRFSKNRLSLQFLVLAVTVIITGCSDKPTRQYLPVASNVVALDDSLTYGYGASSETAYPAVLAEMTRWSIVNEGVNGNTSADVLARTDQVISQNPDLVLLGVGGNDVLRRVQSGTTLRMYRFMLAVGQGCCLMIALSLTKFMLTMLGIETFLKAYMTI